MLPQVTHTPEQAIAREVPSKLGLGQKLLAKSKFLTGYSRWSDAKGSYESWNEAVDRVMAMHAKKYADKMTPALAALMEEACQAYRDQLVLGAQRALQFGGDQLRKHEARMYNCSASYADRPRFFQEMMYLLLCGCGVGFSVQKRHVSKLPAITQRYPNRAKVFVIPDSIEGWADAFGVLLASYFEDGGEFPEYRGCKVMFDYSKIRPEGAMISGGFKAPGPNGLRDALVRCEALLERELAGQKKVKMRPIVAYDFGMHMSDAVLSGGVRRSATICLFDKDDQEMLAAKTGNWFETNPQRGRSNNSVILKRDEVTQEEWDNIMRYVRDFGEPGFVFVDDLDVLVNPCVEIGLYAKVKALIEAMMAEGKEPTPKETSGFQFCNLTEINGGKCTSLETFLKACRAGAILGTLQAGYTDFKYLTPASRVITESEALIGVSITGWMNNPDVLFNEEFLKQGAEVVKQVNREVAALIGIRPAARTTCAKPSGNASVLLGTASGIHGEHAPLYFRNVQFKANEDVAQLLLRTNPKMVEKSVWSSSGDLVVSFPVVSKEGSIYKRDLMGVKQLEFVKKAQQHWVENGTNEELCVLPCLRHNISNTISVDDWAAVGQFIFDNRAHFAGVSLLAASGDKAYVQAPFTEVMTAQEMLDKYGDASMFASGLVVDGKHAFNDNLWAACSEAMKHGVRLAPGAIQAAPSDKEFAVALIDVVPEPLQRDWIRRFHKFANNFFGGDLQKTEFCLKDSHNLHKWSAIMRDLTEVDFEGAMLQQVMVNADTLASQGCAGGACEVSFN